MELPSTDQILKTCRELLAPLVHADGGEMYLVSVTADGIHLHLAGTCSGCPGATHTRERVFEPVLLAIAPKSAVKVTTGWRVPAGATKIEAEG